VTPNAYAESKLYSVIPSDGSGDMSVVRATTATRVNSAGLVELVPYNYIPYSELFSDASWFKTDANIVGGFISPTGDANASKLSVTAANGIIQKAVSLIDLRTVSIYAKRGTHQYLRLGAYGGTISYGNFDLENGVITSGTNTQIEDVGNGWYRCTCYSANGTTGGVQIFSSNSPSGAATTAGDIFIWGAQLNEGSSVLPYQKTETRLNIPRLDYSNGTCPSLLVEPQRTNLVYPSSDFSTIWSLLNSATVSTNQSIAPDGTLTADKITTTNSANALFNVNGSGTTAADYTVSLFIKPINNNSVGLGMTNDTTGEAFVLINLQTGAGTTTQQSGWSNASYKWEQYENGWYRISLTATKGASGNARFILKGNASSEYYIWGAQLEAGSYATSYIPTTSASVTRNADVISKTGISSLIGQTEGTMFADIDFKANTGEVGVIMEITSGASNQRVLIYYSSTTILCFANAGVFSYSQTTSERLKIAFAYKSNDSALYVNGVQKAVSSSSLSYSSLSQLNIGSNYKFEQPTNSPTNAAALWKTRLTNTQLAQLTTI
jgi:hypothetical protein